MEIKKYTDKKEYDKAKAKALKFYQKSYSWYKNIEDGMNSWESRNILIENETERGLI